jgi:aspartate-semialdehyde dehydrogenase
MQAVSGAGLEGFKNKNLLRNVIPNIEGEEDKIIKELPKIFNKDIDIKVRTNRVNVSDGHTFNIFLKTKEKSSYKELINLWKNYKSKTNTFSIKGDLYDIYEDNFMPQPKIVAWKDGGMKTSIGRLVEFSPKEFLFTSVSNNIIRGAAGGTILIAEALNERGVL